MGRKKKQQVETTNNFNSSIGYSGKVTVTVKNGSRTISKKTYKNSGDKNLWYFLSSSLAGKYTEADLYRPGRIMLYWCRDTTVPANLDNLTDETHFIALTGEVNLNRASEVLPVKDEQQKTINYVAVLHFLIPPAYINRPTVSEGETPCVNTIVLYGKNRPINITGDNTSKKSFSAYYLFTKEQSGSQVWDTTNILQLSELNDNYNIIIDWEMSVENK